MALSITQLLKYLGLIERLNDAFKGFRGAKVGEEREIPRIVTNIGSQEWEIPAHTARRLR